MATTFPGTVTPLRGLGFFSESERDVLFGRETECEELARLVTSEGFRAGLLYGESGVGKTSLLRAGLIPFLRDHGVVALLCEDLSQPEESFAYAMGVATQLARKEGEQAVAYLSRAVTDAVPGQQYLFIVDEAELALAQSAEKSTHELGELFARVASRSSGRARFLFACASERLHLFGALERRTGSLFPPSSRFELGRFPADHAANVLERTLALAGVAADGQVAHAIAADLGGDSMVLPLDLQIAALGVVALGIQSAQQLSDVGGVTGMESEWLQSVAKRTGDEKAALRLLAELAQSGGLRSHPVAIIAARASVSPDVAQQALTVLESQGVVRQSTQYSDQGEPEIRFQLGHERLAPRVREVAAAARAAARRAFELLGSKAQTGARLSTREWLSLRREGISPGTPEEKAVLERTVRFAKIVGGVAIGVPLLIIILIYFSLAGRYYLDTVGSGNSAQVVVRSGRSGLSMFHWLPPGFGDVVAKTGFSRSMIAKDEWSKLADQDVGGDREGESYALESVKALEPRLKGLLEYASDGSETSLDRLIQTVKSPEETTQLLADLTPIARGLPSELAFVQGAVSDPSPAVQAAALQLAARTEGRRPGTYQSLLAQALAAENSELRRLAIAAVSQLGDDVSQKLFMAAVSLEPDAAVRDELQGRLRADGNSAAPAASTALAVLGQADAPESSRANAEALLLRAFATNRAETTKATAALASDESAPGPSRILAINMLIEWAPEESYPELVEPSKQALASAEHAVKGAALHLYARVAPEEAAGELALMLQNASLPDELKIGMALAWGQAARTNPKGAEVALEGLLKSDDNDLRAAAAEAYGFIGRRSHDDLAKMIKNERFNVSVGAARGLANSIEVGAPSGNAVHGINQLYKKKGRARREATVIFAKIARRKSSSVLSLLSAAAKSKDDAALHPIAVVGLCNAAADGNRRAVGQLGRVARGGSTEVRRMVIECLADNENLRASGASIALDMADDPDPQVRTEATRILSSLIGQEGDKQYASKLAKLIRDDAREVRVLAISALSSMGAAAPESASQDLPRVFRRGDESERLVVLQAAQAMGAGDLVQLAAADSSARVRIEAIDTAIATKTTVAATISSALTDPDPNVRRAALNRLASGKHGLAADQVGRALSFAMRDRDEALSVLALTTLCATGDIESVEARLSRMLASPSERVRARAATAASGLAKRDAERAIKLLEQVYDDQGRDVRAAMLRSLGTAYAMSVAPDKLAGWLRDSESNPTKRLTIIGAFLVLGENPATREVAAEQLQSVADKGPPMAQLMGRLGLGLQSSSADGFMFLTRLVP